MTTIRALTVCQPYASLLMTEKRVENRTWKTSYRGPLLIHAGASKQWLQSWRGTIPDPMPFSSIVGVVTISHCIPHGLIGSLVDPDLAFLKNHLHAEGPFCWVRRSAVALPEPVACKGALGLWEPPRDALVKVLDQISGEMRHEIRRQFNV